MRLHGVPENIVSDHGVQFTLQFCKVCEVLKIELPLSSVYYPQTNREMDWTNQPLEQYIQCFMQFVQDDWVSLLLLVEFT